MKQFIIDLFVALIAKLVSFKKTMLSGSMGEWESKIRGKAKKDGWKKKHLMIIALCFMFNGCAPSVIVMRSGQSVMIARDTKVKAYVLAEDGNKYKATVKILAGWICGPVDFD